MSKTEHIINEINDLSPQELTEVYKALLKKIDLSVTTTYFLERLRLLGGGVWGADAQAYVNQLRTNDR